MRKKKKDERNGAKSNFKLRHHVRHTIKGVLDIPTWRAIADNCSPIAEPTLPYIDVDVRTFGSLI